MNTPFTPRKARAVARFLCATALLSTPVFAQDVAPQAAAPVAPQAAPAQPAPVQPAIVTPPTSATVDIPRVVSTLSDAQAAAPAATPDTDAAKTVRAARSARAHVTRTVTRTTTARAAPVAAPKAAPVATAPVEAPVATPAPQPAAPAVEAAPQPAAPVAETQTVTTTKPAVGTSSVRTSSDVMGLPLWAWIAGGVAALLVILGGIFAATRRKPVYEEAYTTDYVEPVAAAPLVDEPVVAEPAPLPVAEMAALPVAKAAPRKEPEYIRRASVELADSLETVVAAPDEVHVESAPADDVAELTAGTAPIAERPWLEFAMRPVRAGTNIDEALVEIELTVGNSGSVEATDVRISTFLLSADPSGSEMEKMLLDPPADSTTDPVTIKPGEGKRIDATLALLKSQMGEDLPASFRPVVVADARYTMPDGSEGRTSASFVIGMTPEEGGLGLDPIELSRASMHENVGAELNSEPQHA
jgi:hypothetical protein